MIASIFCVDCNTSISFSIIFLDRIKFSDSINDGSSYPFFSSLMIKDAVALNLGCAHSIYTNAIEMKNKDNKRKTGQ